MEYPLIFFHEDGAGGWQRLENRLKPNDLKINGARVPNNPSEIAGTLQEQVDRCISDGAIDLQVPTKSIPYKSLVQKLESIGLVKPTGRIRVNCPFTLSRVSI